MEENKKISDYIKQLNRRCKLYNDCVMIIDKVSRVLLFSENKNNIDKVKEILEIYLDYRRLLNNPYEIRDIINNELIETVEFIKCRMSSIIQELISIKPLMSMNKIKESIDGEIERLDYYYNNKKDSICIVNDFLNEDIDFTENDIDVIFKGLMKVKNRLMNYASSIEMPSKTDYENKYC